jgi:hypothetical protein
MWLKSDVKRRVCWTGSNGGKEECGRRKDVKAGRKDVKEGWKAVKEGREGRNGKKAGVIRCEMKRSDVINWM